jgi:hypothetical protein
MTDVQAKSLPVSPKGKDFSVRRARAIRSDIQMLPTTGRPDATASPPVSSLARRISKMSVTVFLE